MVKVSANIKDPKESGGGPYHTFIQFSILALANTRLILEDGIGLLENNRDDKIPTYKLNQVEAIVVP